MPWREINGSSYYYQSYREGGKVRNRFIGSGPMAEMVEAADRYLASRRRADRLAELAEFERFREGEARLGLAEFVAMVETVYRALMAAAGYHRHDRGKWRKVRMSELAIREPSSLPAKPTARERHGLTTKDAWDAFIPRGEEILEIFEKASQGDASVLRKLRILLEVDEEGTLARLNGCDSGERIQDHLVRKAAGEDLALRESLRVETDRLREEMAGPDPTASEKLLAERISVAWLNVRRYELELLNREHAMGEKLREEYYRQVARGNRALLEATKALAAVRKMALPELKMQLNLASQQMINGQGVRGRSDRAPASLESHE